MVFCHPHTGRPLDRSKVFKRFKAPARRAGLRPVRFHDLRHTFGTRIAAGVQMRTIQEWRGHRDFKTTLIYADYQPGAEEAALVERAFKEMTTLAGVGHPRLPPHLQGRQQVVAAVPRWRSTFHWKWPRELAPPSATTSVQAG